MYSVTPNDPPPELVTYLNRPFIKSIGFNGFKFSYTIGNNVVYTGGIHAKLKSIYYPDYEYKLRQYKRKNSKRLRKASTKAQGIAIDKQIKEYVKSGKIPRSPMAKAIIAYVEQKCDSRIIGAQIPLFIKKFGVITQADLIIESPKKELIMLEVKSGYNQSQKQGCLHGLPNVANNRTNQWHLQRFFVEQGLKECGLSIKGSYIINVYQEDKHIVVKKKSNPTWTKDIK